METSSTFLLVLAIAIQLASCNMTQDEAQKQLEAAGITISRICESEVGSDCTSLAGIRKRVVNGLVELKQKSGCDVAVVGGTQAKDKETYSNEDGYKVKISNDRCIFKYIKTHAECKRFSKDAFEAVACQDARSNHYSLTDEEWEILFAPKESTFLGRLASNLPDWTVTNAKK